ncbi:MAG: oligosaccharide flippase family protein [Clostridia bacterium]|nr:oligosaccharide flippase family protein [Clostridia bacterium]
MAVVTIFSTVERLIGFIYRIYLSRTLGAEGVGVYQISLSVIGLLMTITASGIPITVSRLMIKHESEKRGDLIYKTVSAGILLCIITSISLSLIFWIFPNKLSFIFTDKRCLTVLKIILPGVIITSVYAVIRGFFWGKKKFLTYSIIEFLEELVMLIAGIILVNTMVDVEDGVNKAGYAVLISYVFSFVTAIIFFFMNKGVLSSPFSEIKPLIISSTPITLMRTATSLINTLIAIILPARLILYGSTPSLAMANYGELSGMSLPLLYIPSTLIGSIALVLVPELSNNYYGNNSVTLRRNIEEAVKCSLFISCMIIPVFLAMGKEIGIMVYKNENAGIYARNSCIMMFPMSISMITTSMLNSLNLERKTLLYYSIGAIFLIVSIYVLPKYVGIYSLIIGLLISYIITATCNLKLLKKTCKTPPRYKIFILTSVLFLIPSSLFGYLLKNLLLRFISLPLTVIISAISVVAFNYAFYKVFILFDIKTLLKSN